MLDIVAGWFHGVAKKVNIVICRTHREVGSMVDPLERLCACFEAIEKDIIDRGLQGSAIIS